MNATAESHCLMYDDEHAWSERVATRSLPEPHGERHLRAAKRSLTGREKLAQRARYARGSRGRS